MVGVAGKSQGCNTCRKRKVKCDGERPSCGQCQKTKRECGGYQRNRLFKNLSALDRDTLIVRKQPLHPITASSVLKFDEVENDIKQETGTPEPRPLTPPQKTSGPTTSLSQLFEHFLSEYVPQNVSGSQAAPVSWLQTVQNADQSANNDSLRLAMTALSLVRLAKKHQSPELQTEGMAIYGQALEGIQASLSDTDLMLEEQTLASCLTLSVFEVLETSGANIQGWISHVEGISRLFQLRGPHLHIAESSHQLFLGFRPTGIIYALATRRPNYIGEEEWLVVPWQRTPKSDFHHLLDIMARIPHIIERTELAISTHLIRVREMDSLVEENWQVERELRTWYSNLVASSSTPLFSGTSFLPIISTGTAPIQPLYPTSLTFPTFEIARMHLFYWAALLLIYDNLSSLTCRMPTTKSTNLQSIAYDTANAATLIAKSVPYLLSPEAQTLGPQNVFFPLRTAMNTFSVMGREMEERWCGSIFEEMDARGFPFGKILAGVEWANIPAFLSGWPVI